MPTLWPYPARGAITERLEWLTDVMESSSGVEQRVALRAYPRRTFEHDLLLDGRDARTGENLLRGNGAGEWYLPVWADAVRLETALAPADTLAYFDADLRDFYTGGYLALISATDPYTVAVHQTFLVSGTGAILATGVAAAWPAGSTVVPLRTARLSPSVSASRFTGASLYGRLRWQCVDLTTWGTATETTYRSYPVMTHRTNWDQDPAIEIARDLAVVDSGNGAPAWFDQSGLPRATQSHRWLCDGRAEIDTLRRWLFTRRGRLGAFWLPSWARDLEVQASIASGATTIDVEHCSYTDHVAQAIGRRDIRILLTDGTAYYRRITGSVEVDADTERLTISSALGVTVAPSAIAAVSFLQLARLDTDAVEIAWHRWDVAEAAFTVRGIRNDL